MVVLVPISNSGLRMVTPRSPELSGMCQQLARTANARVDNRASIHRPAKNEETRKWRGTITGVTDNIRMWDAVEARNRMKMRAGRHSRKRIREMSSQTAYFTISLPFLYRLGPARE